jgi:sarcosine oxidase/L-pipecolate oxidase
MIAILMTDPHRSGVMLLTTRDSELGRHAVSLAQANLASLNIEAQLLDDSQAIKRKLGDRVPTGDFESRVGYSNPIGGWAEASRAVEVGLKRIRQMGGLIRGGAEVVGFVKDGRKVRGVVLDGGEEIEADLVVVSRQRCVDLELTKLGRSQLAPGE